MLDDDPALNKAKLAQKHGISRARVSQIMSLLALPEEIQTALRSMSNANEVRFFSERRLRPIIFLDTGHEQIQTFNNLNQQFATQSASVSS